MPKRLWRLAKTSPLVRFVLEDRRKTEIKLKEIEQESKDQMLTKELARALAYRVQAYHAANDIGPKVAHTLFGGKHA